MEANPFLKLDLLTLLSYLDGKRAAMINVTMTPVIPNQDIYHADNPVKLHAGEEVKPDKPHYFAG